MPLLRPDRCDAGRSGVGRVSRVAHRRPRAGHRRLCLASLLKRHTLRLGLMLLADALKTLSETMPPNNSLQLARLARGKGRVPGLSECARMGEPLPEPPGQ